MAIIATDLLVINRGGVDYKAPASELPEFDSSALEALIQANADAIDALETDVETNADNINKNKDAIIYNKDNIDRYAHDIANNEEAIYNLYTVVVPGLESNIDSNADAISKLTLGSLTDVNATGSTDQVLTQLADGSFGLTTIAVPEVLEAKGFINVADAAPADPAHGDIYIQHQDDESSAVADASFTGISGRTIKEGTFVIFGNDDEWHAGGNAISTQVQSDWSETDQTSPAFILSKPDVYTKTESDAKYLPLNISTLTALP